MSCRKTFVLTTILVVLIISHHSSAEKETKKEEKGLEDDDDVLEVKSQNVMYSNYAGDMSIQFFDKAGDATGQYHLSSMISVKLDPFGNVSEIVNISAFIANNNKTFLIRLPTELGEIDQIEIELNPLEKPPRFYSNVWRPELIELHRHQSGKISYFPIAYHTLTGKSRYRFFEFDTYFRKDDPNPTQRQKDLDFNRKLYAYDEVNAYGGTPMIKMIPPHELFPIDYKGASLLAAASNAKKGDKPRPPPPPDMPWNSYDDMRNIFNIAAFGLRKPMYMKKNFTSDDWFGQRRLEGIIPDSFSLVKEIPDKFGVTKDLLVGLLGNYSLQQAIDKRKLFIVDYWILRDLHDKMNISVCAPIALFYLNKDNIFKPVAIQLFQDKGKDNPVFTPNDDPHLWQLVKNNFLVADASYHESITHLGNTHLMMESVIACTHRNLAPSHPIYKLLRPHFYLTIVINKLAIAKMVNKNGLIDHTMSVTGPGMVYLAGLGLRNYNMTRDSIVPNKFIIAGVTEDILHNYPFRDDFTEMYNVIKSYVKSMVNLYYKNPSDLLNDLEIHAWRKELTATSDRAQGLGLKGVPGDDNYGFRTLEELIEVLTVFISTASVKHASVNFQQYEWYCFIPHHPAYLVGPFPNNKTALTEEYVLSQLSRRNRMILTCVLVNTISARLTESIGKFEVPVFYDKKALQIVEKFKMDLNLTHDKITARNKALNADVPYIWCDPNIVANSISI